MTGPGVSWSETGDAAGIRTASTGAGFTLLESLIALAIMALVVTVLARVHVQTLRADILAHKLGEASLRAESLVSGTLLGYDPRVLAQELAETGWLVQADTVNAGDGGVAWQVLRVAATNGTAPAVEIYMRPVTGR